MAVSPFSVYYVQFYARSTAWNVMLLKMQLLFDILRLTMFTLFSPNPNLNNWRATAEGKGNFFFLP